MPLHARSWVRRTGRQLNEQLLGVPVFVKVMGIALGMAVVLGGGMLWQIHRTWHAHLVHELQRHGQQIADHLLGRYNQLSQSGQANDIATELQNVLAQFPDAVYVIFQDPNGAVLHEARLAGGTPDPSQIREVVASPDKDAPRLRLGLSTARADHEVGWLTRRLALMTAIIALLGMAAAAGLTRIFVRPIEELVALTQAVKAADYHVKARVRASDEVGDLAAAFNEMTEAIAQKETARKQLLRQVTRAAEEERKRIARDLHDHTGQALTSQIASLSALENQVRDEPLRRRLTELRQQAEQTLEEVHDLSVALRPSVLDDVGLMAALQRHCQLFALRSGVEVKCTDLGLDDQRLSPEVELTIYRVVQEALTNAVRHGQATRIAVLVQRTQTGVLAAVQDNGCGFDARDWQQLCLAGNHLGLLGIEERVTLLGGSFCVESAPGKGATVHAEIPLKEQP